MKSKRQFNNERMLVRILCSNPEKYFGYDFKIIAREVKIKECLKAIDILGKDNNYTYVCEVKSEKVSVIDFYNLKNIIERSSYFNHNLRGILIGTKRSSYVDSLCNEYPYIKCIIIDDLICDRESEECADIEEFDIDTDEFTKKLLEATSGEGLKKVYGWKLEFKAGFEFYVVFDLKTKYCHANVYKIDEREFNLTDKFAVIGLSKNDIDEVVFYYKYYNVFKRLGFEIKNKYCMNEYYKIYSAFHPLEEFINIDMIRFSKIKSMTISGQECIGINFREVGNSGILIYSTSVEYIISEMLDEILSTFCVVDFNLMYVLECTNIILNNRLYKLSVEVLPDEDCRFTTIRIAVRLDDVNVLSRDYKMKCFLNNRFANKKFDARLMLIGNIFLSISFKRFVNENIENISGDIRYCDYINTYKYRSMLKKYNNVSVTEILKRKFEITDKDIVSEFINYYFEVL